MWQKQKLEICKFPELIILRENKFINFFNLLKYSLYFEKQIITIFYNLVFSETQKKMSVDQIYKQS